MAENITMSLFGSCINRGVPIDAPIFVVPEDLYGIAYDSNSIESYINSAHRKYSSFIKKIGGVDVDFPLYKHLELAIDPNTLEKKLIFSPICFLKSVYSMLDIDHYYSDRDSMENKPFDFDFDKIKEYIVKLGYVSSPNELKREFPLIYERYMDGKKREETFKKLRKCDKKELEKHLNKLRATNPSEFVSFSNAISIANSERRFSFDTFLDDYVSFFVNVYKNFSNIFDYLENSPVDFKDVRGIRKSRLELYLSYQFVSAAKVAREGIIQDYLYYVSNYFSEHKNKDDDTTSITIKGSDKKITPRSVYRDYRDLLIANPNIRAIDFSHFDFSGFTANEVKEFMDTYLKDLGVNWEILGEHDESIYGSPKIDDGDSRCISEEERLLHQERLMNLFMEKREFYDSSDPYFRIKGKNTFDGYIGFIYPNGRVVLDRFYENSSSGRLADGQAVYAMGIDEFYELSRLSKSELIRNKLCNRYIHQGSWQNRILENELKAEGSIDVAHEVKQLIKTNDIVEPV